MLVTKGARLRRFLKGPQTALPLSSIYAPDAFLTHRVMYANSVAFNSFLGGASPQPIIRWLVAGLPRSRLLAR